MENDSQYFTTTLPESSSAIEEELMILVNEDGEMVLDITQTLSNLADQNQEGSLSSQLVIITTDENDPHLTNSTITYNVLQENVCDETLPLQHEGDFVVDDSHLPVISLQEPAAVSDYNKDQTLTFFQSSNTSDPINYEAPVYIPGEGETLFVIESSLQEASSRNITVASDETSFPEGNHGCDSTRTKIRRILPKPSLSHSTDPISDTSTAFDRKKPRSSTLNYEIRHMNPDSMVVTTGNGPTTQKLFVCDKCPTEEPAKFRRFGDLSRHYSKLHQLRLVKNACIHCREQDCSFKSWRVDDLRKHLNLVHGFPIETQTYNFTSMEEFLAWKTSEEKSSGSKFNRSSGDQQIRRPDNQKVLVYIYYACNRSGTHRIRASKVSGKKKKSNGHESIKINGTCTASIRLIHDKMLNRISCDYCPTHYGHDIKEPHRQNLSKQEKDWILQLLLRGWNSDEIVKTLRNGTITEEKEIGSCR